MRRISTLATLTVAMLTSYAALADEGAFIQAGAGHAARDGGNALSYGVTGGYLWGVADGLAFGAEAGYQDFGTISRHLHDQISFDGPDGPSTLDLSDKIKAGTKAVLLGVNLKWQLGDSYYLTAHGGVARYRERIRVRGTSSINGVSLEPFSDGYSMYDTRAYGGVGFGFDFNPQVGLQFTYDHYAPHFSQFGHGDTEKLDVWSTAVEFRF